MSLMNTNSTYGTAILRGLYTFACTTATGGISAYLGVKQLLTQLSDASEALISEREMIIFAGLTGVLGGLGALGFRGAAEGAYDAKRQAENDVKNSDVQVSA